MVNLYALIWKHTTDRKLKIFTKFSKHFIMHSFVSKCCNSALQEDSHFVRFFLSLFVLSSLLTHVIFPSPYKAFFSSRLFSFTKPYHTIHLKTYIVAIFHLSNLTSPSDIIHALFYYPSCDIFRLLLSTSNHSLNIIFIWSFANTYSGKLCDKITSLFAPLLAAFLFVHAIILSSKPAL